MQPYESEQSELVEMMGRMVSDQRLRFFRVHHPIQAMVHFTLEGLHPGQRLEEECPLAVKIKHPRLIGAYGLKGPHVLGCPPERFDDEPPEKHGTEQARQQPDTDIHPDRSEI